MAFTYEVVKKEPEITDLPQPRYWAVIYVKDDTKNNEREAYASIRSYREEDVQNFIDQAIKDYAGIVVIDDNVIQP